MLLAALLSCPILQLYDYKRGGGGINSDKCKCTFLARLTCEVRFTSLPTDALLWAHGCSVGSFPQNCIFLPGRPKKKKRES